jgi:uncharacterized protein (DUF2249 family)
MTNPGQIVELDVRPHLRNKLEPFKIIMDTVKSLNKEDTLILHATLKPTPLFTLMKTKGYVHAVEKKGDEHWVTVFVHKSRKHELANLDGFPQLARDTEAKAAEEAVNKEIAAEAEKTGTAAGSAETADKAVGPEARISRLDNRGLEPPQPMLRTLKKLESLHAGDELIIHNDRVPMFLIEELNSLGYSYQVEEQEDGSALIHIHKS